ncbi:AbrB/MazE/SpoVT family DNA-binding domain-containing protein [Candidatus Amesbacteria bacterium]|nr:AbrB/MazE/SpoVT family DNA-binding domain-containing protein [Candidatus Amesbacteria bacterium]
MTYTATLTGKQQLTIPADLFRKLNWEIGQKVVVSASDYSLSVTSAKDLVDRLAGSVPIPKKFKGLSIDQIIEKSIQDNHKQ